MVSRAPDDKSPASEGSAETDPTVIEDVPSSEEAAGEEQPVKKEKPKRSFWKHVTELPMLILLAFAIAIIIKTFVLQAYYIPSGSMLPTLHVGDRVLVEKVSYLIGEPSPGDVVVFARSVFGAPPDVPWYDDARNFLRELVGMRTGSGEEDYIKRVVAVGGQTVRYEGRPRQLFVDGNEVEEPYIRSGVDRSSGTLTESDCRRLEMEPSDGGCLVPAGKIFVMGDNRSNSRDSRSIGPVDEDKVVGHAFVIVWPPGDIGTL